MRMAHESLLPIGRSLPHGPQVQAPQVGVVKLGMQDRNQWLHQAVTEDQSQPGTQAPKEPQPTERRWPPNGHEVKPGKPDEGKKRGKEDGIVRARTGGKGRT